MGLDVEAVPIHGFLALPVGREQRAISVGKYGQIQVSIVDPYVIALSKIDRGFETDIDDILFLIRQGHISFPQLEKLVQEALLKAPEYDISRSDMLAHLKAVQDEL